MIKAKLLARKDKYYGTEILLKKYKEFTEEVAIITINLRGPDFRPSKRELKYLGCSSQEEFQRKQREEFVLSDDHFETISCYEFCEQLCKQINKT